MLQCSIEALDRKDLEVLSTMLENVALPSKQSARSPPIDNNTSLSSLVNILADLEFTCLL